MSTIEGPTNIKANWDGRSQLQEPTPNPNFKYSNLKEELEISQNAASSNSSSTCCFKITNVCKNLFSKLKSNNSR